MNKQRTPAFEVTNKGHKQGKQGKAILDLHMGTVSRCWWGEINTSVWDVPTAHIIFCTRKCLNYLNQQQQAASIMLPESSLIWTALGLEFLKDTPNFTAECDNSKSSQSAMVHCHCCNVLLLMSAINCSVSQGICEQHCTPVLTTQYTIPVQYWSRATWTVT